MAVVAVLCVGMIALRPDASLEEHHLASEPHSLETTGEEQRPLARRLGEPLLARAIGSPIPYEVLAFAAPDVSDLAESIARSRALDNAQLISIGALHEAIEDNEEVCAGVPRPTTSEEIMDGRAFRITQESAVLDIRITEFASTDAVARVLQNSRSAWEACHGSSGGRGGSVNRSVLPFTSLSGTPGVNLRSDLVDDFGTVVSSSQTLAVPADDLVIEVRLIVDGMLQGRIDPVAVLDEVEALL